MITVKPMGTTFSKEQKGEIISSIRRYCTENLDADLSDLQAGFLLDYFMKEIAPFAYNKGVEDAQAFIVSKIEDLPGTCFHEPLTHWNESDSSRAVRRKPDR